MDAPKVLAMAAVSGLPCSSDSTVAMSCARAWMAAAHSSSLARRNASSFFEVLYASPVAATASSTWACDPRGQVAKGSPRVGLTTASCSRVVTRAAVDQHRRRGHRNSFIGLRQGIWPPMGAAQVRCRGKLWKAKRSGNGSAAPPNQHPFGPV